MGDPRRVRPDELEVLVARELRKAGVTLSKLGVTRIQLSAKDPTEYSVELGAVVGDRDALREALIECRNAIGPIDVGAVQALDARRRARAVDDGPARLLGPASITPTSDLPHDESRLAMMFSMSGYEPDAVREATSLGIALFAIADGPAAFRRSRWAVGAQPPAWVPEYMAELVDLDPTGAIRYEMLGLGKPKLPPLR